MSKYPETVLLICALALSGTAALAGNFGLGRPALPEEVAAWNGDISPDGADLPPGSGDPVVGEEIFADKCAACHGDFAEGIGNWPKLAGGMDTLNHDDPLKTVGSYWPYLSTTFDYVKRSMPFGNAGTLTDDEVYALVAYILYSNDLIDEDFVLSKETFHDVEMPNAGGFILDDRLQTEHPLWSGEPCMENCKDEVKVTMRARVLDVTPKVAEDSAVTPAAASSAETAAPTAAETGTVVAAAGAPDPEQVAAGEKLFRKCTSCHQVGEGAKNKTGPVLNGVVGHPAGAVEGFKYSSAFKTAAQDGLVWTEEELLAFLAKPKAYLKGTRMSFPGFKDENEARAVIAYLKSIE